MYHTQLHLTMLDQQEAKNIYNVRTLVHTPLLMLIKVTRYYVEQTIYFILGYDLLLAAIITGVATFLTTICLYLSGLCIRKVTRKKPKVYVYPMNKRLSKSRLVRLVTRKGLSPSNEKGGKQLTESVAAPEVETTQT